MDANQVYFTVTMVIAAFVVFIYTLAYLFNKKSQPKSDKSDKSSDLSDLTDATFIKRYDWVTVYRDVNGEWHYKYSIQRVFDKYNKRHNTTLTPRNSTDLWKVAMIAGCQINHLVDECKIEWLQQSLQQK